MINNMRKRTGVIRLDVPRLLEAIRREQDHRELTSLQVASQLHVNPSTIRQWSLGVGMSGDVALRVAHWLGCDLRDYTRPPADPLPVIQGEKAA